jgi:iron(III) transport system permease protein
MIRSGASGVAVDNSQIGLGARVRYTLGVMFRDPTTVVGIVLALVFAYLIVVPVVFLLLNSVFIQPGDANRAGGDVGGLTGYYFQRTLLSPAAKGLFWEPLGNTLSVGFVSVLIALVLGCPLAWLLSRTNLWGRRWFATALIVPYMLPAWTFALAWMTLFRNRSVGGYQGWLEALGFSPPDWLSYGQMPISIIMALHYVPFVILLLGNALRRFDSQLEDCARMLGARPRTIAFKIIMPMMLPAITSAVILVFAKSIGEFGVPYVLGLPVKYDLLSTALYRSISTSQAGVAAVLAGAIMILGVVSLMIDAYLVREARKFVTVGGKGNMNRPARLGFLGLPAFLLAAIVFIVSVAVPLIVLFISTVTKVPGNFNFANFTLDYWIGSDLKTVGVPNGILLTQNLWRAAFNTLWIVGSAAIAAGVLGLLVGYVVVRTPVRSLAFFLRQVTFMPYLVPGLAFAVAYLVLFAVQRGPVPALYGTGIILLLALLADQMPYASRAGISAMMQLGKDPEEAAQIAGASWVRRMWSIIVPIQKGALVSGILLPFIAGIKGLSLVVILAVPGMDLLSTYSLRLVDYGYPQAANAVVLIIAALSYFGTILAQRLTRTNLADGLGG